MFEAEAKGLSLLTLSDSFTIPQVIKFGNMDEQAYLIMEYIPSGAKLNSFWLEFSKQLAKLHWTSAPKFGLDHHNYIGSLEQKNNWRDEAAPFYISERLEPQFEMARVNGYLFSNLDTMYKNISKVIPKEPPSLIHGDLWNGNYLISPTGQPVLIDPAVAYAPREMDLAMMSLFGGFPPVVFSVYHEIFPLVENWEERVSLWQLYYLLVHLNLFGKGYLSRVEEIVKSYT